MHGLKHHLQGFLGRMENERGAVAPLIGLLMLPLMMTMGLVIDGGLLFFNQRLARNAADAGALEGARVLYKLSIANPGTTVVPAGAGVTYACTDLASPPPSGDGDWNDEAQALDAVDKACLVALSSPYSYTSSEVSVQMPPLGDPFDGEANRLRVVVARPYDTLIIRLLGPDQVGITAPAVGGLLNHNPAYALYVLGEATGQCETLKVTGGATLDVDGGIKVNTACDGPPGNDAVEAGGTIIVDGPFDVVGDADVTCPPSTCPTDQSGSAIPDPLAPLPEAVKGWCDTDAGLPGEIAGSESAILNRIDTDPRFAAGPGTTNVWDAQLCGLVLTDAVLKPPVYVPPVPLGTPNSPARFDACSAPPDIVDPTHIHVLPGVYWGGIELGNCSGVTIHFHTGVYVLAGNDANGANVGDALDLVAGNGQEVSSGQVLFYVTEDPFANNNNRKRAGAANLHNTGSGEPFSLESEPPPGPPCPNPSATYIGILLMVNRDGPGKILPEGGSGNTASLMGAHPPNDITSTTDNDKNRVGINGGAGFPLSLRGVLYSRDGILDMQGGFSVSETMLIFKFVVVQNATTISVTGQDCFGTTGLPYLMH